MRGLVQWERSTSGLARGVAGALGARGGSGFLISTRITYLVHCRKVARRGRPSGGAHVLPEPVGEFVFGEVAGGERLHRGDRIDRREGNLDRVEREEGAREHPSRALVAIGEGVIAGKAEGMRGGKAAQVVLAIFPLVAGAGERGFERAHIAHAARPAMFGELAIMDRERKSAVEPDGFQTLGHRLLGEFAQDIAVFAHHAFGSGHLGGEVRIGGGDADAIRAFGDIERIAHPHPQPREQLLGQHDAGGVADFGDFERGVHTGVITQIENKCYRRIVWLGSDLAQLPRAVLVSHSKMVFI